MELRNGPVWRIDWKTDGQSNGKLSIEQYEQMEINTESDVCTRLINLQGMVTAGVGDSETVSPKGWSSIVVTSTTKLHASLLDIFMGEYHFSEAKSSGASADLLTKLTKAVSVPAFDPRNN